MVADDKYGSSQVPTFTQRSASREEAVSASLFKLGGIHITKRTEFRVQDANH